MIQRGRQCSWIRASQLRRSKSEELEELKAMQVEKIFMDKLSGKNIERPELQEDARYVLSRALIAWHAISPISSRWFRILLVAASVCAFSEKLDFDAARKPPVAS